MDESLVTTEKAGAQKHGVGPVVSTVIVVVLIVLGGLYFFAHQEAKLKLQSLPENQDAGSA